MSNYIKIGRDKIGQCPVILNNKLMWVIPLFNKKCKPVYIKKNNSNWTGNQILLPEIGVDIIGMGAVAILMFIGIISFPVALFLIGVITILSYFFTKHIIQKMKNNINNFLQNIFHIPYQIAKKITNYILDIIGVSISIIIIYIIYLEGIKNG